MSDIPTDEVARRLQHSARAVREWMAQDCPPDETPKLAIALLAEFARSVADDHLKRPNVRAKATAVGGSP